MNTKTGELMDSSNLHASIDFDKVAEYRKSLVYYQIISSEIQMDAREIIDKYHGLTQIEDQFRVMKSSLETRPIYVRTPEHIDAHLLICLISLIIMRIIQKKIKLYTGDKKDVYLNVGMSADSIQASINKWKVDRLPDELYRFMDIDDPDLNLILNSFGIKIPTKLYRKTELKSIKTETKIFM